MTPLQSVAVYAGQFQRLACACASARETLEVNVSDDPSGQLLVTLQRHFTLAAKEFAAARVAARCVTPLQSVAVYTGGGGAGQFQASARACASDCETLELNVSDTPLGQDLVTVQRHLTLAARAFAPG